MYKYIKPVFDGQSVISGYAMDEQEKLYGLYLHQHGLTGDDITFDEWLDGKRLANN